MSLSIAAVISSSDSSWLCPRTAGLVEPCVLDSDGSLRREQRDELLVLVREVGAALLLGQVEVAVGDTAQDDRNAEEALHGRVVGREANRALVLGDVMQSQRPCVADEDAEDSATARKVPDRRVGLGVDPVRDESLQLTPHDVDDAERRVAGARQLGCGLGQESEGAHRA